MNKLTKNEKIRFLESITLPLLYEEGYQLQFMKEGKWVDCYDPAYEIHCEDTYIEVIGWNHNSYTISYEAFDYIEITVV